jgi:DNA-binding sugar fermentation-stimulating protein
VGAYPSLGERIAEVWLRHGLIEGVPPISAIQRQITKPAGADMRADFMVQHADGSRRIVEIKTVVDTDYAQTHPPTAEKIKCVFTSDRTPYRRAGIFPWGSSNQKGPDGEKVVSSRAIHHVQELTKLAQGRLRETVLDEEQADDWDGRYLATLLFVVIRDDAVSFRPNREACPSFARYLGQARKQGVQVLAKRAAWGSHEDEIGNCYDDVMLPINWDT